LSFEIYPCLNPYGYDRHRRTNRDGEDANRLFRHPEAPLTGLLAQTIGRRSFEVFIDLHEDEDFEAFYLYETVEGSRPFAPEVRERMGRVGPWAREARDPVIREGLADEGWAGLMPARSFMDAQERWPFDYYLYDRNTSHVVTIETPGRRPMGERVEMQCVGIETVLDLLLEDIG